MCYSARAVPTLQTITQNEGWDQANSTLGAV